MQILRSQRTRIAFAAMTLLAILLFSCKSKSNKELPSSGKIDLSVDSILYTVNIPSEGCKKTVSVYLNVTLTNNTKDSIMIEPNYLNSRCHLNEDGERVKLYHPLSGEGGSELDSSELRIANLFEKTFVGPGAEIGLALELDYSSDLNMYSLIQRNNEHLLSGNAVLSFESLSEMTSGKVPVNTPVSVKYNSDRIDPSDSLVLSEIEFTSRPPNSY